MKDLQDMTEHRKESTTATIREDQHIILRGKIAGVLPFKIPAAMISTNGVYYKAPFPFKMYIYIPMPPLSLS